MTIDIIIPARNEAPTVADSVAAALGCAHGREVIVVDDGSTDDTADVARAAGAKVLGREAASGSKAHAMAVGVDVSDADAFLFVDADLVGITAAHLDAVCRPWLDGRAALSVGMFDYGPLLSPLVVRLPPLSGERLVPRWVFDAIPAGKLDGYTIEMRINEVIAEARLATTVQVMEGVRHRTKRHKLGRRAGLRATWEMYRDLTATLAPGGIRWRTYPQYLQYLTVSR